MVKFEVKREIEGRGEKKRNDHPVKVSSHAKMKSIRIANKFLRSLLFAGRFIYYLGRTR